MTEYDELFIDNVNKELSDKDKIDKKEADKAHSRFKFDFEELQRRFKDIYGKLYDKTVKEVMCELFEDDSKIEDKNIEDLQYYIYKNEWFEEFDIDGFNDKQKLLIFLNTKLEERVKNRINEKIKETWNCANPEYCWNKVIIRSRQAGNTYRITKALDNWFDSFGDNIINEEL